MENQAPPASEPAATNGTVKKSISIPTPLYARMSQAMTARGLTNESAFIANALVFFIGDTVQPAPEVAPR